MNLNCEIERKLTEFVGKDVEINDFSSVGGGSINKTFKISTNAGNFFIKKNSISRYPQMFEKEAEGIKILHKVKEIDTPEVIGFGESGDEAFLILKFISTGIMSHSYWEDFGKKLAKLHKHSNDLFGLNHNNYIGSLNQSNNHHKSWSDFFREERLEKQVKLARNSGSIGKETVLAFDRFYSKIDDIFPNEPPALLHGDLWSGNFMTNDNGDPVIIDPAVYYGHREMDLGMSQLFGGFDGQFYSSYHRHYPLESGWEERLDYCNLYPLMVHVNLFGGGYLQSVKSILRRF
ncbi:MAG: fructosamine kinase family protein [Bacteroidetes bacterium]|nr:fructosamine kinase family protein [Bacteroidota bacterium]MBL6944597.1 fructosamine kinase family protein [Bacteroidales bacterium]